MKNLYKWELNIETGYCEKIVIEDVTVVNNRKIVRKKERKYDLDYGRYTCVTELNRYSRMRANYKISYISLKDDVDISKMQEIAIDIINEEIKELEKQEKEKRNLIKRIQNLEVVE